MSKKMFGYSICQSSELMVGVVAAADIHDAKERISMSFGIDLDELRNDDFKEIDFDFDGVCEIYYGS